MTRAFILGMMVGGIVGWCGFLSIFVFLTRWERAGLAVVAVVLVAAAWASVLR